MKTYAKPRIHVETILSKDELLAMNPHIVEYSWGTDIAIDSGTVVGDVTIQVNQEKGTREEWGDLW